MTVGGGGLAYNLDTDAKKESDKKAEAILKLKDELEMLRIWNKTCNLWCADCYGSESRSVNLTYGTFICSVCASIHREVFKGRTSVKSLEIGIAWGPQIIQFLDDTGNDKINKQLEDRIPLWMTKPNNATSREDKEEFIRSKYEKLEYWKPHLVHFHVGVIDKKKKIQWDRRLLRLDQKEIQLFISEKETSPVDKVDLMMCTIKEVDPALFKDSKFDIKTFIQLFTPKSQYVLRAETTQDLKDWLFSFKIANIRLRSELQSDNTKKQTPKSPHPYDYFGPSSNETSTPMASAVNGSESPEKITLNRVNSASELVKKKFQTVTKRRDQERERLKARLSEVNSLLEPSLQEKERSSSLFEQVKVQIEELETKKQRFEFRLNQLVEVDDKIIQTKTEENVADRETDLLVNEDGSIRGGTVKTLVETLTNPARIDTEFMFIFLITYRSFTTSMDFLQKLKERFQMKPPDYLCEEDKKRFNDTLRPIQLKVVNVLKHWLSHYFYNFENDLALSFDLLDFIDNVVEAWGLPFADQLRNTIEAQIKGISKNTEIMLDPTRTPPSILPNDLNDFRLDDLDNLEIARQFCLVEYDIFKTIKPRELLNQSWTHKTLKEVSAPNVLAMIRRFNRVSQWVTTRVVNKEHIDKRVEIVTKFIMIALNCRKLHNFNATQEILAGLEASPCHRLKRTWKKLEPKVLNIYESLKREISPENNFLNIRSILHQEDPPSIPYLGIFLTDLTFIEDGNPDLLADGLINFTKRKRLAGVIQEIKQYQQSPFHLLPVPQIYDFVRDLNGLDEAYTYSQSLVIEPKGD
eukprot:TRINITY_DN4508_c0_g1_i2.p1 TRINITY_DN4508_c0_g1~~TRINITY_DN4508_c0_g1_i2.p1  ORF type:complete len:806 (+),score=199.71 TRINITY_DN4508_c0_g1_i2:277-2694(+)